ncbi:tyrosyl-DNA phosphodiesterase 1 [Candidatus Absconditicoccus praedator]|uniref:tyrosyl-DNA phosphodiesterase 1 n=1 Tax=Candidatus Absconditicoccus praedator TaxID=2735562 RepID=UPI001E43E8B4|nr:tyrosyl-DNA phosphodiesterase 1 [Candidatus Absconditicoccus praedator]UFX82941.1 hypothetical protein HLG78_02295 [Candidatus Absconditicoccus praedator]
MESSKKIDQGFGMIQNGFDPVEANAESTIVAAREAFEVLHITDILDYLKAEGIRVCDALIDGVLRIDFENSAIYFKDTLITTYEEATKMMDVLRKYGY